MPTTTNFGWTTPADTDLVKDGALAIRTLGNGIDTSLLDLKGGTTGQNLRKATNTDLDFTWAGDATNTVVDAEGDLLVGDSADTLQRLAIGTTGQVLTADTTIDGKIKWSTLSATTNSYVPTGKNVYVTVAGTASVQGIATEDVTYYGAVFLPTCTVDRIATRTGASFTGTGAVVRLGIYENGSNNLPGNLLLDAGTITATAASTTYEITISQAISAGVYWLAFNRQTAGSGNDNFVRMTGRNWLTYYHNDVTQFEQPPDRNVGWTQSSVTGAFANAGTVNFSTTQYYAGVRIS